VDFLLSIHLLSVNSAIKLITLALSKKFNFENGYSVPSVVVLVAIDILQTTPNDILGYVKKEVTE